MKFFPILLACVLSSCIAETVLAQNASNSTNATLKLAAADAKAHVGANAVVTGKIAEVNIAERLIRLNFDQTFPNQTFTAVIFADKTNLFPEVEKLKGKTVSVSGKIAEYRDRPQIVLTATNQLSVIEKEAEPAKPAKN